MKLQAVIKGRYEAYQVELNVKGDKKETFGFQKISSFETS